jgi:hypothetical protein
MNSVERVMYYTNSIDQERTDQEGHTPPPHWPEHGAVELKDVKLRCEHCRIGHRPRPALAEPTVRASVRAQTGLSSTSC